MSRSDWIAVIVGGLAIYAAYLALGKTEQGHFMIALVLVVNSIAFVLLLSAIARNWRDAYRARDKQAAIDTLNVECELQKEAAGRRLKALKAAAYDLQTAGQLRFLAEDVLDLQFRIMTATANPLGAIDLTYPLADAIWKVSAGEHESVTALRVELMTIRETYGYNRKHSMDRGITAPPLGNETIAQIQNILTEHYRALSSKAESLAKPYVEALQLELR
jgi:hypothetical protein